jgi:hypothetical protein
MMPLVSDRVLSKPELRASKPNRRDFAGQTRRPIIVVLDRVTGLYNIGALFRLCDAVAAGGLIPGPHMRARGRRRRVMVWYPVTVAGCRVMYTLLRRGLAARQQQEDGYHGDGYGDE